MLDLLFRSRFRWRLQPRSVTADAAYGTTENIAAIEKADIRAYTALADHENAPPCWAGTPSLTMPKKTSIPVLKGSSCAFSRLRLQGEVHKVCSES